MNRTEAAAEYRKLRALWIDGWATLGVDKTAADFVEFVRGELPGHEDAYEVAGTEVVTEREATPAEWAEAAGRACSWLWNSYNFRNAVSPSADREWEAAQRAAGLAY